jgi:G3E family GTPase
MTMTLSPTHSDGCCPRHRASKEGSSYHYHWCVGANPSELRGGVASVCAAGFLGAGKTTLLNYILTADHGKRICVIENEYGEDVGVEALVAKDGVGGRAVEDFFELANGCLCCTVRDDLVETLERVLKRRDRYDYILVETTGMANPGPVASAFWADEELESAMQIDSIVTVVDSLHISSQSAGSRRSDGGLNEAVQQIAHADIVLLNKTDLVADPKSVEELVKAINPACQTIQTVRSRVDLDLILDVGCFSPDNLLKQLAHLAEPQDECHHPDHEEEEAHDHHHVHVHGRAGSDAVQTLVVRGTNPLSQRELIRFVGSLVWEDEGAPVRRRANLLTARAAGATDDSSEEEDAPPMLCPGTERDVLAQQTLSVPRADAMDILRVKGVVCIADKADTGWEVSPRAHVLQGVEEVFELTATETVWPTAQWPESRILFIGKNLNLAQLREGIDGCAITISEDTPARWATSSA